MLYDDNILFYKRIWCVRRVSNFAMYPIVIHDVIWYTSEHHFQAMKFPHDPEYQEQIRTTKACHDIKRLGSTRQIKLRSDWEAVKENLMMIAFYEQLLINILGWNSYYHRRREILVEHTENDN